MRLYASEKTSGTCSGSAQARQAALPADASCEDLQIDVSLPFLNAFVQQALESGAAPYISQQQRDSMGVMPTSRYHEAAEQPHALRFAAYETAKAPGSAHSHNLPHGSTQGQRSRSNSPVKGVNCSPLSHLLVFAVTGAVKLACSLRVCCAKASVAAAVLVLSAAKTGRKGASQIGLLAAQGCQVLFPSVMCTWKWCCVGAGVHGDASMFPAAQPAAPAPAASAEPQLTLRGAGGARRWGPAHFEAAPAASSTAAAPARAPATGWPYSQSLSPSKSL